MEFFEESNLELPTDFVNEYEDMSVGEEVDYDYEELSEFYNSLTMAQKMALGEEVDYDEELYNSQTMAQKMALMIESTISNFMQVGIIIILCIIFRIFTQSCKFFSFFLRSGF